MKNKRIKKIKKGTFHLRPVLRSFFPVERASKILLGQVPVCQQQQEKKPTWIIAQYINDIWPTDWKLNLVFSQFPPFSWVAHIHFGFNKLNSVIGLNEILPDMEVFWKAIVLYVIVQRGILDMNFQIFKVYPKITYLKKKCCWRTTN